MSLELITEIQINNPVGDVWNALMDFKKYPKWNPFIKSITGNVQLGEKFKANIDGMKFKPRVLTLDKNKEFKWLGHLFIKGIFDGEHRFRLIDNGDGTTRFIQSEKFKGILVPVFKKKLFSDTKKGFESMNEALKKEVEE